MNDLFHWDHFKEDQMEFYQLYIYFVFLFIDQRCSIWLTVDEWMKKLNEKRMMKKTIRIINKNEFIDSNDINNKLIRWMKGNEWLKWFGYW